MSALRIAIRLWSMSIQACVLILIVLAARRLLKKYPKIYVYVLWGLVGLRLLCPVFIETSFSLQPDIGGFVEGAVYSSADSGNSVGQNTNNMGINNQEYIKDVDNGTGVYDKILEEIRNQTGKSEVPPLMGDTDDMMSGDGLKAGDKNDKIQRESIFALIIEAFGSERSFKYLSVVYYMGAGLAALFYVVQYIIIRRKIAFAIRTSDDVWLSENVRSPFVIGLVRPRIILPYGLEAIEEEHILKHERTHIRHHDPVIRALGILCIVLHWWNPLVWLAVHRMNQDMEMFCDEAVLSRATAADRKAYARTLVEFSVKRSGFLVGLSFGESNTERRVKNIMKKRKSSSIIIAGLAVLVVFCVVAFMTIPGRGSREDGSEETTTASVGISDTAETKVDTELLDAFLKGEINASRPGTLNGTFNISELDMSGESWDSYSVGEMIDLDNDGERELILSGPYGGMYLDASDGAVNVFAEGEGTAGELSYSIGSDGGVNIVHRDTTHEGRIWYRFDKYLSADRIVDSATLVMYNQENAADTFRTYYYNDKEISASRYSELYQKYTGSVSVYAQISLIEENINMWKISPDYANDVCSYAVCDLDKNGRLEVIAANMGGTGNFTYSHFYEVNETFDALVECETNFVEGISQPDIIEDTVDMYYVSGTDTYYYVEYDLIREGTTYYILKNVLSLKDGKLEVNMLTREVQNYGEEVGSITYWDSHGNEISEERHSTMADDVFFTADKYKANIGWRDMKELTDTDSLSNLEMLKQSYDEFNPFVSQYEPWHKKNEHLYAYETLLDNILQGELPDSDYGEYDGGDMSLNTFAVFDVDGDGYEELIINYVTTYNGGMITKIYGYDAETNELKEEFAEYPTIKIYSNGPDGIIFAYASHNHGRAPGLEDFWPYRLYEYNRSTDTYDKVAIVDAWDKNNTTWENTEFPENVDKDGDGIVYCVMLNGEWDYSNAMDNSEYEAWLSAYMEKDNMTEMEIQYMELKYENEYIVSAQSNPSY